MNRLYVRLLTAALLAIAGARLGVAGTMSGAVLDPDNSPIQDSVLVGISSDGHDWTERVITNGEYSFDAPSSLYIVRAKDLKTDSWFYREYYPDFWDQSDAQWVFVPEDGQVDNIDIAMHYGGRIASDITPAEGGQFNANSVIALVLMPSDLWFDAISVELAQDPDHYLSPVIPPGDYSFGAEVRPPDLHVPTFYGNTPNMLEAETFSVAATQTTQRDISSSLGGGIAGHITAEGNPYRNCAVFGYSSVLGAFTFVFPFWSSDPDENGAYGLYGLPVGNSYVSFVSQDPAYSDQWYNGAFDPANASSVAIVAGQITENIDAVMAHGVRLSGTVTLPDGGLPDPYEVQVSAVDRFGNENELGVNWTGNGAWNTSAGLTPGIYTLRFHDVGRYISDSYLGGERYAWNGYWMNFWPNTEVGPLDINLQWGGMVSGVISDPDGNPAFGAKVTLYDGVRNVNETGTNLDGEFFFTNVTAGSYRLAAEADVSDGIDAEKLWPRICSGGVLQVTNADNFDVPAQETTFVNLQLARGGRLHLTVTSPDEGYYMLFQDNVAIKTQAVTRDRGVMWEEPVYPESGGLQGVPEEGIDIILPEGDFTVAGFPVFSAFRDNVAIPNVRRTFLGGTYTAQGADFVTISPDETINAELQMNESDHQISGTAVTKDGKTAPTIQLLRDSNGLIVCAYTAISVGEAWADDPSFIFRGIPDGTYYLMAMDDNDAFYVSTWYPDIAAAGMVVENMTPPDGADQIQVAGNDVAGIRLVVQNAGDVTGVARDVTPPVANEFRLLGAYPNPFNSVAWASFNLPRSAEVKLNLFDIQGREVAQIARGKYSAGVHSELIRGGDLPAGLYLLKMEAAGTQSVVKLSLLK